MLKPWVLDTPGTAKELIVPVRSGEIREYGQKQRNRGMRTDAARTGREHLTRREHDAHARWGFGLVVSQAAAARASHTRRTVKR